MRPAILGIDPGAKGCVALIASDLIEVWCFAKHTSPFAAIEQAMEHAVMGGQSEVVAYIEKVGGFVGGTGQPGSAMFKFGLSTGRAIGALEALGIPFYEVAPGTWQKTLPKPSKLKGPALKRHWRDLATQRFPALKPTLDTADALLIAEFGARTHYSTMTG